MHKTLYVDVDEEITSIIDRIRIEESPEIFLVVPKQAMLTQGVINLKILKKEIEKIGKSVMIATSDVHARKVIERLGIRTKEMTREFESPQKKEPPSGEGQFSKEEDELAEKASGEAVEKIEESQKIEKKKMSDIGSESFFEGSGEPEPLNSQMEELSSEIESREPVTAKPDESRNPLPNMFSQEELRRDLYAKKIAKTGAVSQPRTVGGSVTPASPPRGRMDMPNIPAPLSGGGSTSGQQSPERQFVLKPGNTRIPISNKDPQTRDLFGNDVQQEYKIKPSNGLSFGKNSKNEKAERFFSEKKGAMFQEEGTLEREKKQIKSEIKKEKGESSFFWKLALPVLILLLVLGGLGFWGYSNYPKVNISIYPKKTELSKEIKIVAGENFVLDPLENKIEGAFVELEIEKTMNFDATGEAFESDDGKARGKVKIYNLFSSSEQPLVEKTRVLSKEGKLFRLTSDVDVPGMDGEEPGVVEVGIIADEPGEEYNIPPSTFTIEGFKGNPKYEKFEVRSEEAITNGGTPDSNKKMTVVTSGDIEKARIATAEALENDLEKDVASKLDENRQVIIDSVEKEIVSASASHKADEVANQFSYSIKQKIKAITFDPKDVSEVAGKNLEGELQGGSSLDSATQITFKKGIVDFEAKTLTMYINANAIAWPKLDQEKIAQGIAGKKEQDIKTFLADYPQIEKVEISIVPSWLTTIPVSRDKIKVEEKRQ